MHKRTWEQKARRAQQLRQWRKEESNKKAEIYPLRIAVNKALKNAGIKHSVTHYSSRVKGWPMSTSEGWETESIYWSDPKYVKVEINVYHSSFHRDSDERMNTLITLAEKALENFVYRKEDNNFLVFRIKE